MKLRTAAQRLGRLFVIKTRWEAWAVTWAIALGAAERGKHYLAIYPGAIGWMFFAICCAVVFVAGAKLLDATRLEPELARVRRPALVRASSRRLRQPLSRNRPTASRPGAGSGSRSSRHTD
ncbi:hypothetical protein GCM10022211_19510 [Sphingomonas humi]|uniref:Uncharacterized protein n=1 Tax=Sphingomonas humi TaxID=335630 RepID=A0ABP7S5A2_9SPHN